MLKNRVMALKNKQTNERTHTHTHKDMEEEAIQGLQMFWPGICPISPLWGNKTREAPLVLGPGT